MLDNAFGIFLYLLLPNHWSWWLLTDSERQMVKDACFCHNNKQYLNPTKQPLLRPADNGKYLRYALNKYQPHSVLEIGIGYGRYCELILAHPTIETYHAIDIVQPCLVYVEQNIAIKQNRVQTSFIYGDFRKYEYAGKYDMILFNATLHHIPNRAEYVKKCTSLLSPNGVIIIIEPTHNIFRIGQLVIRYIKLYHKPAYWLNRENLSTHHFITMLEIRHVACKSQLCINEVVYFNSIYPHIPFHPLSQQVYVCLGGRK